MTIETKKAVYLFTITPNQRDALNAIAKRGKRGMDPEMIDGRTLASLFRRKPALVKTVKNTKKQIRIILTPRGEVARKL